MLSRTSQPVTLAGLEVFPRPGLCVARLRRPDVDPEWSVEMPGGSAPARVSRQAPSAKQTGSTRKSAKEVSTPSPRKK